MAGPKLLLVAVLSLCAYELAAADQPMLSKERMVFQTDFGDIHMAFYPEVWGGTGTSAHLWVGKFSDCCSPRQTRMLIGAAQ